MGAEAGGNVGCDCSCKSFLDFMGIADAVELEVGTFSSGDGDFDMPEGEAMEEGKMKSSRFIASDGSPFV